MSECSVDDCGRKATSLGMCAMHRRRFRLYGDVGSPEPRKHVDEDCSVEGCSKRVVAKGLCAMHYARKKINGTPGPAGHLPRRAVRPLCSETGCANVSRHRGMCQKHYKKAQKFRVSGRKCSIPGCNNPHEAKGMCEKHYLRVRVNGDPNIVMRKVDYALGEKITLKSGYIRILLGRENRFSDHRGWCLEHRFVMGTALGRLLYDDETVHHKNGDRADNRLANLELKSGHHGAGQTAHDLLEWAREIISRYAGTLVDDQGTF